jgi:hypothetical protein
MNAGKIDDWQQVEGRILAGHGVASGRSGDRRFPGGTIKMQMPFFARHGVDLSAYYPGTLNVSIAPASYEVVAPVLTLRNLKWCPETAAEDFSLFDCRILVTGPGNEERGGETEEVRFVEGLVYRPHPETKPEHFQDPHVLEILAPKLERAEVGGLLRFRLKSAQLRVH